MDPASRRPSSVKWIAGGLVLGVAAGWFVGGNTWRLHAGPEWYETELFARKGPLDWKSTLSLHDGAWGMVVQNGTLYNRDSHLDFDHYAADRFSVGVQGNDDGRVVDLGPAAEVARRVGGSPLARLRWIDESLCIDGRRIEPEVEPASGSVGRTSRAAPVRVGHLYLVAVRWSDVRHRETRNWTPALVEVLEHEPRTRVKIRWNHVR